MVIDGLQLKRDMKVRTFLYIGLAGLLLGACKDSDAILAGSDGDATASIIRVGGVSADYLVTSATVTRAGGDVDEETVKRTDAENVSWLIAPLKDGLNITYGLSAAASESYHAQLKLLFDGSNIRYSTDGTGENATKYAEYSFNKYDDNATLTEKPAQWLGNGRHFFQGVYVPAEIKTGTAGLPADLTTDQHDDNASVVEATETTAAKPLGNYTLLTRYLAMPSNFTLNATVARVKLPFRHRLARVLAYILIDPALGSDVTLEGYNYQPAKAAEGDKPATDEVPDDPTTTKISFSNVRVLQSVTESGTGNIKTYTPQWTEARKAVPHFVGERGSYDDSNNTSYDDSDFIAYYDEETGTFIYPTDSEWKLIHKNATFTNDATTYDGKKYTRTKYGRVPVYDLIVRPTYSLLNNVMYDEDIYDSNGKVDERKRQTLNALTNQIDFELSLSNDLHYTKKFTFDLDANYQTVVYLHISRERVDYNSSGSALWTETRADDDYYGVNNQNGNNLSFAGSSWQRAYTNVETTSDEHPNPFDDKVTDGHFYTGDDEDEFAQYVSDDKWIEMFIEAYEGGRHHGDYFILHKDISIPAAAFPAGFVFTGHLDGQDHTITITDGSYTKKTYHGTDVSEETLPGKTPPYYLFSGLNGKYSTVQEGTGAEDWEANVHKESNIWVPYKTDTDGWRAEMINTNFIIPSGSSVFQLSAKYGIDITGYLYNCWINSTFAAPTEGSAKKWTGTRIQDYIPSIPEY